MDVISVEEALSSQRLGRFLEWAAGDAARAMQLYVLNCRISESLYVPLHFLEIVLRNRIDAEAARMCPLEDGKEWLDLPEFQLGKHQAAQVAKARKDIVENGKAATRHRIISTMTFSYWTVFFNRDYENHWRRGFHRIARRPDGSSFSRKEIAEPLDRLRHLRNRIAHHEPVLHWDLQKHHRRMSELISCLSPPTAALCRSFDRFPSVYPPGGVGLAQKKTPAGEESAGAS